MDILVLLPISLLLAGCPTQTNQVVPDRPFIHRGVPHVSRMFIRAYLTIERLDEEHSNILRETTRMVRDDRFPLTIDVFALLSAAVEHSEFYVGRRDRSLGRFVIHYCEMAQMAVGRESTYHSIWSSYRDIISRTYPNPTRAIQCFVTIITFIRHPSIPMSLRFRVNSIFRQALLILQLRESNYQRIRQEVLDPLLFVAYVLTWSQDMRARNLAASTQLLQHLYTTMIDIVREGIEG